MTWDRLEGATKYRLHAGSLGTFEVTGTGKSFVVAAGSTHTFRVQAFGDGTTFLADWGSSSTDTVTTETPPTVTIRRDKSTVNEGESARFTLTGRPAPIFGSIMINISAGDPDNRLSPNYTSTVRLKKGSTTASLSLRTKETSIGEDDGTVTATIASSTEYHIYYIGRPSSASVTIRDDDDDDCEINGTPTPTPTPAPMVPPPGQVPQPMLCPGNLKLDVSWDPPQSGGTPSQYNVRYRRTSVVGWVIRDAVAGRMETIPRLINDREYEVQVRACNSGGCGLWSESATETVGVRYAKPRNLKVIPLPRRQARLTWEPSKNEDTDYTVYDVYAETPGGTSQIIGDNKDSASEGHEFHLDRVILSTLTGLDDEPYFSLWVVAKDTRSMTDANRIADSDKSDEIRIIDSPILSINGKIDHPAPPVGSVIDPQPGKAVVKWEQPESVLTYTLRWRKLGDSSGRPHSDHSWKLDDSSLPSDFHDNDKKPITDPLEGRTTITAIDGDAIYAFQLNFLIEEDGEEIPVFSARDRSVWTSDKAPEGGDIIASFPLGHPIHNDGYSNPFTYAYRICEDTFPGISLWRPFIVHALEQWESATDGLVHMEFQKKGNGRSLECARYSNPLEPTDPITEARNYIENTLGRPLSSTQQFDSIEELSTSENEHLRMFVENTSNWMNIYERDLRLN